MATPTLVGVAIFRATSYEDAALAGRTHENTERRDRAPGATHLEASLLEPGDDLTGKPVRITIQRPDMSGGKKAHPR